MKEKHRYKNLGIDDDPPKSPDDSRARTREKPKIYALNPDELPYHGKQVPPDSTSLIPVPEQNAYDETLSSSNNKNADEVTSSQWNERPPSPVPKNPIGQSENVPPDLSDGIESNTPLSGEINVPPFTKHGSNLRTKDTNHHLKTSAQTTFERYRRPPGNALTKEAQTQTKTDETARVNTSLPHQWRIKYEKLQQKNARAKKENQCLLDECVRLDKQMMGLKCAIINTAPALPKRSIKLLARNLLVLNDPKMNHTMSQIYFKKFNRPLNISDTEPTPPPTPPGMNEEETNSINDESTNVPQPQMQSFHYKSILRNWRKGTNVF